MKKIIIMPNGKTHDRISLILAPIVFGLSYYIMKEIQASIILFCFYIFSSLMFNGDLDTNSKPYNRWWVFKMIWIPYQLMFHHRSVFTHGLIIGTVIRILYLSIIPLIILLVKGKLEVILAIPLDISILIFIGLELGSAIHTISDKIL